MLNGYRVFVLDDGKGLERDSGNGYTKLCIYLMPPNYTFKNVKIGALFSIKGW